METETVNVADYINKINKVEAMLEEIKQGLAFFDKNLQESIERGEKDIEEGKVTVCKTERDLNIFFDNI
jgi:archaellum component FlaC